MRVVRRRLAAETPDAGARAAALWPGPPAHLAAPVFAVYHPAGSELDPGPLRARLPPDRVALPVVVDRRAPLVFRLHQPGQPLVADALGVLSPTGAAPEVEPDVVFAPLLAFDREGGRLGQGGGFYDRTLADLRRRKPVFVVGLAYAGQALPKIPMEPHDARLDAILTETDYRLVG